MTMVKRGEKVRDCYGKVHTVLRQNGTTIYTYTCGTERIHASNCWRVKA